MSTNSLGRILEKFQLFYSIIRTPGVIVHELAHLLIVVLIPGIKVESVDIFSEVEHSGQYSGTRIFAISYAPLYINTTIAYLLLSNLQLFTLNQFSYISAVPVIGFLAFSLLLAAVPSYIDAINPVTVSFENLKANPVGLVPLFFIPIIILSIPFIVVSSLLSRFGNLAIVTEIMFSVTLILIFLGHIDISPVVEYFRVVISENIASNF